MMEGLEFKKSADRCKINLYQIEDKLQTKLRGDSDHDIRKYESAFRVPFFGE